MKGTGKHYKTAVKMPILQLGGLSVLTLVFNFTFSWYSFFISYSKRLICVVIILTTFWGCFARPSTAKTMVFTRGFTSFLAEGVLAKSTITSIFVVIFERCVLLFI